MPSIANRSLSYFLRRGDVVCEQVLGALKADFRVFEFRFPARECGLSRFEIFFKDRGVELNEDLIFLDVLPFFELNGGYFRRNLSGEFGDFLEEDISWQFDLRGELSLRNWGQDDFRRWTFAGPSALRFDRWDRCYDAREEQGEGGGSLNSVRHVN